MGERQRSGDKGEEKERQGCEKGKSRLSANPSEMSTSARSYVNEEDSIFGTLQMGRLKNCIMEVRSEVI